MDEQNMWVSALVTVVSVVPKAMCPVQELVPINKYILNGKMNE